MKSVFHLCRSVDRILSTLLIKPIVIILSILVAGMLALGIFTRAFLGMPLLGLEELILICVMWLYMLGAALASQERSHLRADFVQAITKNTKVINFMHFLATLISLVMAVYFSVWSFDLVMWGVEKQQATSVFQIPWHLSQSSLLVASLLFIIYLIRDTIHDFLRLIGKDTHKHNNKQV